MSARRLPDRDVDAVVSASFVGFPSSSLLSPNSSPSL